ncbi:MAG: DUF1330 domain-containing protein [Chloroflexi bacterium]|nr:DUF1330 domain-containing protein [Chloroflexota bacterium]
MAGYIIADIDVTDPAGFEEYRQKVSPMIAKWGGKYLVRGGSMETVEGEWAPKRLVVLEFESLERAKEFYRSEDYRPVMEIRHKTAVSNLVIVEGA